MSDPGAVGAGLVNPSAGGRRRRLKGADARRERERNGRAAARRSDDRIGGFDDMRGKVCRRPVGCPRSIASTISATPMPAIIGVERLLGGQLGRFNGSSSSGTVSHSPRGRANFSGPPCQLGCGRLSEPSVPWISRSGCEFRHTSQLVVRVACTPRRNVASASTLVMTSTERSSPSAVPRGEVRVSKPRNPVA